MYSFSLLPLIEFLLDLPPGMLLNECLFKSMDTDLLLTTGLRSNNETVSSTFLYHYYHQIPLKKSVGPS